VVRHATRTATESPCPAVAADCARRPSASINDRTSDTTGRSVNRRRGYLGLGQRWARSPKRNGGTAHLEANVRQADRWLSSGLRRRLVGFSPAREPSQQDLLTLSGAHFLRDSPCQPDRHGTPTSSSAASASTAAPQQTASTPAAPSSSTRSSPNPPDPAPGADNGASKHRQPDARHHHRSKDAARAHQSAPRAPPQTDVVFPPKRDSDQAAVG
jgi:hypothetical protein